MEAEPDTGVGLVSPLISVITVSFNAAATIEDTLASTAAQSMAGIEHIVVDGGSTDRTMAIVEKHRPRLGAVTSGPDQGIYDAMNKGLAAARGEYVAYLNADDYYASADALRSLHDAAARQELDVVWGNVVQVRDGGLPVRLISARTFSPQLLTYGIMPPHPGLLARTQVLRELGGFQSSFRSAGDFELMLRLFQRNGVKFDTVATTTTAMRIGGQSTSGFRSYSMTTAEVLRALRENDRPSEPLRVNSRYAWRAMELAHGSWLAISGRRYGTDWFR